ncbi:hypothetical protein [Clostridium culturomicium]|uniref:hypothetical protein n=1 Tax=Clostridium culturomicium TaxID=1499683 RepID=UPI00058C7C89|nr:hypothetical protein [Clostridium culturomicium]
MGKDKFKILKFILSGLVILIPIIKILIGAMFEITLMSDMSLYSYIVIYAIIAVILIAMVKNFSFSIAVILYLCIYGSSILLTSGTAFNDFEKYRSPNNEHILLVKVVPGLGQSTSVHFYEEINLFLKRAIPTLDGSNPARFDVFWSETNTPIISGDLIKMNKQRLEKSKETLEEKCDFEIEDEKIYLKLRY